MNESAILIASYVFEVAFLDVHDAVQPGRHGRIFLLNQVMSSVPTARAQMGQDFV